MNKKSEVEVPYYIWPIAIEHWNKITLQKLIDDCVSELEYGKLVFNGSCVDYKVVSARTMWSSAQQAAIPR